MIPVLEINPKISEVTKSEKGKISIKHQGRGDTFTINCSGLSQHGVDPAAFQAVFDRKAFRPVTNFSIPTHVNISFILSAILEVMWDNPFISWNPEEYVSNNKLTASAENLWLPNIIIMQLCISGWGKASMKPICKEQLRGPPGLTACVSSKGRIQYDRPMKVTSTCNLDIFYFLFDQLNCTFTFSSLLYTGGVAAPEHRQGHPTLVDSNLHDQIMFSVTIRCRPSLYVINLLVPSSFLIAIDALSFYLPAESENCAPFKMTLLMGYNVFLLMTLNDLLPASGTPPISTAPPSIRRRKARWGVEWGEGRMKPGQSKKRSCKWALREKRKQEVPGWCLWPSGRPNFPPGVYLALCLSLMVVSLLETIFITYLLHLATTQPPPRPRWLRVKEPVELVGKVPGPREAELNGCPGSARAQQEDEAQKQHSVSLWLQLSHMTDTLLFRLCLLFPAPSVVTVIILWDT
ncbi:hypothetical protein J1605_019150 [Eschrichtius robustus]|uniref:Neurotransmitter-gated ion-channel ligand-binding domain-containing protein n=1 Tax=Eschrichtius robustus TaxID=9764 RepID=A0AB34HM58_ESCRO|nr:hypothetical protein J1605_019150 [Eschrichtius robustus]